MNGHHHGVLIGSIQVCGRQGHREHQVGNGSQALLGHHARIGRRARVVQRRQPGTDGRRAQDLGRGELPAGRRLAHQGNGPRRVAAPQLGDLVTGAR
ncbi:hypothetical protein, partial [Streptomyces sp. SID3343]|uniref:hypothetical protein n=1 Tax=Streptomyces sp. SID3343 TaxID=2690260 RepID=UPI0013705149